MELVTETKRITILLVVLYGAKSGENKPTLQLFENKIFYKMFYL
jgi:hypothetical protein